MQQNAQLSLLVFTSGLAVMAVEMTGLRLLAPYFGTSLLVTTILIGSMMGFLSLGYSLGGKYGDIYPTQQSLSKVTLGASVFILLIPLVGRPILQFAAKTIEPLVSGSHLEQSDVALFTVVGGMLGILLLFAVPVTLMGMVSPWAIRLGVSSVESSGKAAGKLYSLSTFGSILGSLLPAIVLIPTIGVRQTFFLIATLLAIPSIWGVFSTKAIVAPLAFFVASSFVPDLAIRPAEGVLHESESLYHFIQVKEEPYANCPKARHLFLNEGIGVHSVACSDPTIETQGYWTHMAMAPLFLDDIENFQSSLIIGLAGGTMGRQLLQSYPHVQIDGVEIDEAVVEVGKEYFDNANPHIHPIVMDGRIYLQQSTKKYDLIQIDAYRQPYIPFHLVTKEFFHQVHEHLNEGGVLAVNVASVRGVSEELVQMIYKTIRSEFPWAIRVKATRSNDIIIATLSPELENKDFTALQAPIQSPKIKQALARLAVTEGEAIATSKNKYINRITLGIDGWENATILTDDYAPVEMAWDMMTLEFMQ